MSFKFGIGGQSEMIGRNFSQVAELVMRLCQHKNTEENTGSIPVLTTKIKNYGINIVWNYWKLGG